MARLVLALVLLAATASAQTQPAADTSAYQTRCASCHGSAMTGGSAASILTYIRYHTDAEVAAAIRDRHQNASAIAVQEPELRLILSAMRALAGTNPAMATGGFTGRRGGAGGGGGGRGTGPAPALPRLRLRAEEPHPLRRKGTDGLTPAPITMADGRTRTGILLGGSETSAVLLENGRFTLPVEGWRGVPGKNDHSESRLDALRRQPHRQSLQSAGTDQPHQRAAARRRLGVSDRQQSPRASVDARGAGRHHVRHRVE